MNAALWLLWVAPAIVAAQAGAGDGAPWAREALDHALSASGTIEDPFRRAQSFAEIAEIESGLDGSAALSILQKASESASKIDNAPLAGWARHDIALAYVKAGALDEAQKIAEGLADARPRDAVLAAIAAARRADGSIPEALAIARRMHDADLQGGVLRALVMAQAEAGELNAALATARGITHPTFNALALADVAAAEAKGGDFDAARRLALGIRNDRVRGEALTGIAAAQADRGDRNGALSTVAKIDDRLERAKALAKVAEVQAEQGAPEPARDLFAQSIELAGKARGSAAARCAAFIQIARSQAVAQELPAARQTVQLALGAFKDMKPGSDRLSLLAQIVPTQARVGDHAGAMATASKTEDASLRPLLVRDVATSQAEAGDVAGALQAARSLGDRHAGAAALFGILRVQSDARDVPGMHDTIDIAADTVRVIRSETLRAGALGALASARLEAGEANGAQVLFDEAMQVASQAPEASGQAAAFIRIADALVERGR